MSKPPPGFTSERTADKEARRTHADTVSSAGNVPGRESLTQGQPPLAIEDSLRRAIQDATRFSYELAASLDAGEVARSHILAADLAAALDVARHGLAVVQPSVSAHEARTVAALEANAAVLRGRLPSWTDRDESRFIGVLVGPNVCAPITSVADADARLQRALEHEVDGSDDLAAIASWLGPLSLESNLWARLDDGALVDFARTLVGQAVGAIDRLVQRARAGQRFKGLGPDARNKLRAAGSLLRVLAGEASVKDLELRAAVVDAKKGMLVALGGVATLTVAGAASPLLVGEAQLVGWSLQQAWTLMLQNPTTTVAVGEWLLDAVVTIGMAGGLLEYMKALGSDPRALIGAAMLVIHGRGAILSGKVIDAKSNAIVVRTAKQAGEDAPPPVTRTSKAYNRVLSDVPELAELWNKAASKQKSTGDPRTDYDQTRDRFVYALTRNTPAAVAARKVLEHDGFRFLREKDGSLKSALPVLDLPDLEKYITTSTIDMFRLSFQHLEMLVNGGAPIDPKNLMLMTGRDNNQMDKGPAHIRAKTVDQVRGKK